VRARRARIAHFVAIAQRVGYGALGVSIVSFGVGLANSFPDWLVTLSIATLCTAILVLPVPIVLGYGVKAAEREERRAQRLP
jgi:predicted Kef-type K+ transport protein